MQCCSQAPLEGITRASAGTGHGRGAGPAFQLPLYAEEIYKGTHAGRDLC